MVKTFKQELEEVRKQLEECKDNYLRLLAEFDNYKKRMNKEKEEVLNRANERFIKECIEFMDQFEMALKSMKKDENEKKGEGIYQGVKLIYKNFKEMLSREGVEGFSSSGGKFDPTLHEVVGVRTESKLPTDWIIEEVAKGYKLRGRLLRPAKVIVNKK